MYEMIIEENPGEMRYLEDSYMLRKRILEKWSGREEIKELTISIPSKVEAISLMYIDEIIKLFPRLKEVKVDNEIINEDINKRLELWRESRMRNIPLQGLKIIGDIDNLEIINNVTGTYGIRNDHISNIVETLVIDVSDNIAYIMPGFVMDIVRNYPTLQTVFSNNKAFESQINYMLKERDRVRGKRTFKLISGIVKGNNSIGVSGKLLWRHRLDMSLFLREIDSNDVIMGRATYEELTKPLGTGTNYVLTRRDNDLRDGFTKIDSIYTLLDTYTTEKVIVCGGEKVYRDFIHLSNMKKYEDLLVFETQIHMMDYGIVGDRFFPMNEMYLSGFVLEDSINLTSHFDEPDVLVCRFRK